MKFLHTSDWHVGKTLKGRSRLEEQEAVLREIVAVAEQHEVDAVLVAGDLYDHSAPSAEAQGLVVKALAGLAKNGAKVIAIAGNHDHPIAFDAYRPVMQAAGITLVGRVRTEQNGGVIRFVTGAGEPVVVAVLPFLSQRYAVRAAELVTGTPAENSAGYDRHVRDVLARLTAAFTPESVNLVMTHVTVAGGAMGGGERAAQSIFEYYVPAAAFPADAHYVALGHLHRRQNIAAQCPVVYSGSPLAVDFGEQDNTHVVCVVEAHPGTPAVITDVPITSGRRLRTVTGTVAELLARAAELQGDYLRVRVREKARAGLREELQEALPDALEIRIDEEFAAPVNDGVGRREHAGRTPGELFADYLAERQVEDPRLGRLFAQLHDELYRPELLQPEQSGR
jgi:exonuclease SbcD